MEISEVQALKEENERLKRQIKEQAVSASTYVMPPPPPIGGNHQEPKKQDQGIGPPDIARPMLNKPRKNSVQPPTVTFVPEKSHYGPLPEHSHVQTRYKHNATVYGMCKLILLS